MFGFLNTFHDDIYINNIQDIEKEIFTFHYISDLEAPHHHQAQLQVPVLVTVQHKHPKTSKEFCYLHLLLSL